MYVNENYTFYYKFVRHVENYFRLKAKMQNENILFTK